ncbi:MAG: hypothetical protein AAF598_12825, partial [Bacteroidota bacterium]
MFSFFRKKSNKVPEWASFFTKPEYASFEQAVKDYFQALNAEFTIDDGVVRLDPGFQGLQNLGLVN